MIVAIDIGGTKTRIGFSYLGDFLLDSLEIATPRNQRKVVPELTAAIHQLIGRQSVDSIGIAAPGSLDTQKGIMRAPHHLNWRNLKLVKPLGDHFGCTALLVHDATAGGIAEARLGAGQGLRVVSYVTFSTGLGTSIIIDGQPLASRYNSEGGSQILERRLALHGSLVGSRYSSFASGSAIKARFGEPASALHSKTRWDAVSADMALGIYNIVQIVQPDIVVIGGGVATHYKHFIEPLNKHLGALDSPYPLPPIVRAKFYDTAPAVGAMLLAAEL